MACDTEEVDAIEACRTCGIYYMSHTNYLKPLFQSAVDYPEVMQIRFELAQWKVELSESDGLPQYVCSTCIHEFQKIFKFRAACIDTQDQLRVFYNMREENLANLKIKTEIIDTSEADEPRCDFIYVDDFSDEEYDGATPFNIPHVPIKEELIEEATVPREDDQCKSVIMVETARAEGVAKIPHTISQQQSDFILTPALESNAFVPEAQTALPELHSVECELCQYISANPEEHKQHMRRVHENHNMECHICGKVFKNSTQSRFKFHLKWHNINKHVKCPQCGFVCSSSQGLKEHKRAVHARIHCKICGKGVIAKKMKSHLRGHEIVSQFPCEYCAEVLSSEQERETHIWQIHANGDNDEPANNTEPLHKDGGELMDNNQDDSYGQKIVHIEVTCAQCDEKFEHAHDLELHVKMVHFNSKHPQQHVLEEHNKEVMEEEMQTSLDPVVINNSTRSSPPKLFFEQYGDEEPPESEEEREESEDEIAVFEGYDEDDGEDGNMELPPQEIKYSSNMTSNDNPSYFSHIHTNNQPAGYKSLTAAADDDDDDEVMIEHFDQEEPLGKREHSSSTECETETSSKTSFIPNDIPQYACAKCPNTFTTIDGLRGHYKQHQAEQTKSPPKKSKFKCQICDKQFDLKFSLNRHIRKHKNLQSSE